MLRAARAYLRQTVAPGQSLEGLDQAVQQAAPRLSEEHHAVLWLYAWHHAEADAVTGRRARAC